MSTDNATPTAQPAVAPASGEAKRYIHHGGESVGPVRYTQSGIRPMTSPTATKGAAPPPSAAASNPASNPAVSEVRRYVSPYANGTESFAALVDTRGRIEPDSDEGPFYVLASDYDALLAERDRLRSAASAEGAALRADAQRYRWLRKQDWVFHCLEERMDLSYDAGDEEAVDSGVDAGMREAP